MNSIIYGFEIIMKINKNIFCNVRFSVLKVFEIEAELVLIHCPGLISGRSRGTLFCKLDNSFRIR